MNLDVPYLSWRLHFSHSFLLYTLAGAGKLLDLSVTSMALVSYESGASDESEESTVDWSAQDNNTPKRKVSSHATKSSKCQKSGGEHMLKVQTNVNWAEERVSGGSGAFNPKYRKEHLTEGNAPAGSRYAHFVIG